MLYEIERRGGSVTTYDLISLHISQYQSRLKGLREKMAENGWTLTEAEPVEGQKRNFLYWLIKLGVQRELCFLESSGAKGASPSLALPRKPWTPNRRALRGADLGGIRPPLYKPC